MFVYVSKESDETGFYPISKCEDRRTLKQICNTSTLEDRQIIPSVAIACGVQENQVSFHEDCGTHEIWKVADVKV